MLCAKNPQNVDDFLNKLKEKMRVLQKGEMDLLLNYKKQDVYTFLLNSIGLVRFEKCFNFVIKCEERNIEFDGKLNPSDMRFYSSYIHF